MMILPMQQEHAAQIAALEKLCFSDPWSEISIKAECTNPLSYWLVAQEEDKLLGYVGSQSVWPEADVMNLAVMPERRGEGLGKVLMTRLIEHLCEDGITALFLEVRPSNVIAQSLYKSLGFVEVGRRKKYYVNPTEDALILRKEL